MRVVDFADLASTRVRMSVSGQLNRDGVTIQVVDHHPIRASTLFIDEARNTVATRKAVIVVNYYAALNQARPYPLNHVFCRLINIHIDMTKAKQFVSYRVSRLLRKDPFQKGYVANV